MLERCIPVQGTCEAETAKAFLLKPCVFDLDGVEHSLNELWIPKSRIADVDLDDENNVIDAVKGDDIEINVADWWLRQEM
jgi:hypothetical protein